MTRRQNYTIWAFSPVRACSITNQHDLFSVSVMIGDFGDIAERHVISPLDGKSAIASFTAPCVAGCASTKHKKKKKNRHKQLANQSLYIDIYSLCVSLTSKFFLYWVWMQNVWRRSWLTWRNNRHSSRPGSFNGEYNKIWHPNAIQPEGAFLRSFFSLRQLKGAIISVLGCSQEYHRRYYAMQQFMSLAFVLLFHRA